MGMEWLAGGVAVMGIALITGCHDAWRGLRLKRARSGQMGGNGNTF